MPWYFTSNSMAFNRKARLQTNINAIRTAFALRDEVRVPTDAERETISRYYGFGGLKCVLNPVDNKAAIEREQSDASISSAEREQARLKIKAVWPKSDLPLYDLTAYRMCLCCIRKT